MIQGCLNISEWSLREGFIFPKACKMFCDSSTSESRTLLPVGDHRTCEAKPSETGRSKVFPRWRISLMTFCWMLLYNMIRYACIYIIYIFIYVDIEYIKYHTLLILYYIDMIYIYTATEQHYISSCFTEKLGQRLRSMFLGRGRSYLKVWVVSHWVSSPRKWHVLCPPETISPGNKMCQKEI